MIRKILYVLALLVIAGCAVKEEPISTVVNAPTPIPSTIVVEPTIPEPVLVPTKEPILDFSPLVLMPAYTDWVSMFNGFVFNDMELDTNASIAETRGEEYITQSGRIEGATISAIGQNDYVEMQLVMYKSVDGANSIKPMIADDFSDCNIEELFLADAEYAYYMDCDTSSYVSFGYANYYVGIDYYGNTDITNPKEVLTNVATKQLERFHSVPHLTNITYQPAPLTMDDILVSDFFVYLTVIQKQCFGSAGCSVTVTPELSWTSIAHEVNLTGRLVFEIYGDEDGTLVSNVELDGEYYHFRDIRCSTVNSDIVLTAKAVRLLP